jgi:hypothetical protein
MANSLCKRFLLPALLACAVLSPVAVSGQVKGGDAALGRWKLNVKLSRFLDPKDRLTSMVRTYEQDGDQVKVKWDARSTDGKSVKGGFSAKCDGNVEQGNGSNQSKCTYVSRRRVDGEVIDESDPGHRYYTRQVSADGGILKIIWYRDAERRQVRDVMVFERAS